MNLNDLTKDAAWTMKKGPISFQIGLATFGILALELALIRWTSGQVRMFAYFNNLVLIAAFLGMGLGVALGKRRPGLVHFTLPALLVLSVPLTFSPRLGIMWLSFPDHSVSLWGAEINFGGVTGSIFSMSVVLAIFSLIVGVFLFAGTAVGHLFGKLPPLRAYTADLIGSLAGVVVFTVITFFDANPPAWLFLGSLPFAFLSRRSLSLVCFAVVTILGFLSVEGAIFSPYNRIDVVKLEDGFELRVNRDFHQYIHNFSEDFLTSGNISKERYRQSVYYRSVYNLPFEINPRRGRALIVGAGTGNDVQAALRNGYQEIYSIDIDKRIVELGRALHPEKPYSDPRVTIVVNDARAFFEQYRGEPFDVIDYGLLDSHAMFSSMSSLRLDNYVYTEEGIRSAWRHLSKDGHLCINFSIFAGPWMNDRIYWTIFKATGVRPFAVTSKMHWGATYVVASDMSKLNLQPMLKFKRTIPSKKIEQVDTPSDDWPFLYVRPGTFPRGYVLVLSAVITLAALSTRMIFGKENIRKDFDLVLFFMGAAFLLIETRGVTSLSLLFGSTWVVNSSIFGGILIMVLAANLLVECFQPKDPSPWFVLLAVSVVFLWYFNVSSLNQYSLPVRGIVGGLINALPVGFAGVIVSMFLARSPNPAASLGSNLLGSVVGGCLEYLSMYLGLKALALMALILYLTAILFYIRSTKTGIADCRPEN